MASSFLERNKKQAEDRAVARGSAALSSPWLVRRLGPMAAVMVVGMGFLMTPGSVVTSSMEAAAGLPGVGDWVARAAGLPARSGKGASYAELMAALKAARQEGAKSPWGLLSRAGRADSLGMVRGRETEALAAAQLAAKLNGNGGTTIAGILSPGDAKKGGGGVQLRREDLLGETAASSYSGRGMKVYAGKGLLTGGRVAPAQAEDSSKSPLRGAKTPDAGKDRAVAERAPKLTKAEFNTLRSNREAMANGIQVGGPGSALAALADARTTGQMARSPNCTADNGCPPEYANTSSAAVYDHNAVGKKAGSVIQAAPAVRGIDGINTPAPILPEGGEDYKSEVEKIQKQHGDCAKADAHFKPLIDAQAQRITALSMLPPTAPNQQAMRATCLALDDLMRQQYEACPLRHEDGAYVPQNCG